MKVYWHIGLVMVLVSGIGCSSHQVENATANVGCDITTGAFENRDKRKSGDLSAHDNDLESGIAYALTEILLNPILGRSDNGC
ncbi:hypothetical protein [Shewanella maritima]|uniref:hypothetical protein n=1 Tax=Shewanella maritima TaxID=2520507 RepID=UPI003736E54E